MPRNRRLGAEAEDFAADYLIGNGCTIVTRNYHARVAEIDIIALDGETLVFVEVRQRASTTWERPPESVNERKQKRLWEAAGRYLAEMKHDGPCRFDLIAIEGSKLSHYKDAFRP